MIHSLKKKVTPFINGLKKVKGFLQHRGSYRHSMDKLILLRFFLLIILLSCHNYGVTAQEYDDSFDGSGDYLVGGTVDEERKAEETPIVEEETTLIEEETPPLQDPDPMDSMESQELHLEPPLVESVNIDDDIMHDDENIPQPYEVYMDDEQGSDHLEEVTEPILVEHDTPIQEDSAPQNITLEDSVGQDTYSDYVSDADIDYKDDFDFDVKNEDPSYEGSNNSLEKDVNIHDVSKLVPVSFLLLFVSSIIF